MAKLVFDDKTKTALQFEEPQTRRRLTSDVVEHGLGAEYVGDVPAGGNPLTVYAVRSELFRRLRSTGGRPGLADTDKRPKIPVRSEKWQILEEYAKQAEEAEFHPTPTQIAAILLEDAIDRFDAASFAERMKMRA